MSMFDEIDFRGGAMPWGEPPRRSRAIKPFPWIFWGAIFLAFIVVVLPSFPAFFRGRPDHAKLGCASNLRQMGLGIAQYVNVYGLYPPGTIPNPNLPLDRRLGWGMPILPYLDEIERSKTPDEMARLAWDDPACADLVEHPPGISYCRLTKTSYLAIAGLGLDAPALPTQHPRAGIFGDDRRVTPADLKDGSAHTMMLAESDSTQGPWFAGGRHTVRGLDPANQPYIGQNRQLGGNHPRGANVLMADGSLKFVSESIDPKILEALSTIGGGEAVPTDFDD
jgi:prepilin-type processing-associated H-X9-DG protein